jgi:large subunit ribosomal protein L21
MFAVIRTGGKQYRVSAGDRLKVESLSAAIGEQVRLGEVLALGEGSEVRVGTPLVPDASVTATVLSHGRHPKVRIFKLRRRKHFQKHAGHRQGYTELQIDRID